MESKTVYEYIITASADPIGGIIQLNLTTTVTVNFTVSYNT